MGVCRAGGSAILRSAQEYLRQAAEVEIHVIGIGQPGIRRPVYAVWSANGSPDTDQSFLRQLDHEGKGDILWTMTDSAERIDFRIKQEG
jgi:hypothetical protein